MPWLASLQRTPISRSLLAISVALLLIFGPAIALVAKSEDGYGWVLKEFGIARVQVGQHVDVVLQTVPELYFRMPRDQTEMRSYRIGVVLDPAHFDYPEGIKHWSLALWFDKSTNRVYTLRATFPPLAFATDSGLINSVLDRLGPPIAVESEPHDRVPNVEIQVLTWATEGFLEDPFNGRGIVLRVAHDTVSGEKTVIDIVYTDFSYISN